MTPFNALKKLLYSPYIMPDPGASGTIDVKQQLGVMELTSGTTAETRTLLNPPRVGIRFCLRLKTDGGGDITVTASNGLNVSGNTNAVFADAGDQLDLVSVSYTTGFRWEILTNTGSVALS